MNATTQQRLRTESHFVVRDTRGRALCILDGENLRDDGDKILATAASSEPEQQRLSRRAAHLMSDRLVTMDLGPGDVTNQATQAIFGIPAADFVADRACATKLVAKDRGYFYAENVTDATNLALPDTGGSGEPAEINPAFTKTAFQTVGYALAARLPRAIEANADWNLIDLTVARLVLALRLAREYRIAGLLTTAGNWATGNQVAATAKWNGGSTANPLTDLFAALAASALPATAVMMPETAAQYFFQNANSTAMRDYVQSGGEMPEVVFARAKYTVGGAFKYIWAPTTPANIAIVRAGGVLPTAITLRWLGEARDEGGRVEGMIVRRYSDAKSASDWIVVAHNDAEVMVVNNVGALITGALD